MTLIGSLSGFPISKLVAGPVAQLIEDQLAAAGRQPVAEGRPTWSPAYPPSTAFISGAAEGAMDFNSVAEAYGEWNSSEAQAQDMPTGEDR